MSKFGMRSLFQADHRFAPNSPNFDEIKPKYSKSKKALKTCHIGKKIDGGILNVEKIVFTTLKWGFMMFWSV